MKEPNQPVPQVNNPIVKAVTPLVKAAVHNVAEAATSVGGWGPLAGLSVAYVAHIRHEDKQAGTAPHKKPNRHVGRDYEW